MIIKKNQIINKRNIYEGAFLFILSLILMLTFRNLGVFCDEADNIIGGMVVSEGGTVYKDFYSQHTPLMYYLCGLFRVLGATTIPMTRIYFYIFLSILFVLIYFRYSRHFGKIAMAVFPILYIFVMATSDMSHMVLSDQVQAMALVVLFLEFIIYIKTKKIELNNCIWISMSIFVALGVAFVSLFAIIIICLGVILIEFCSNYKSKITFLENIKMVYFKLWKLVLICLLPFILTLTYELIKGNLYNTYEQSYYLNTAIYSKYTDGYGSNVINSFISPIRNYWEFVKNSITGFSTNKTINTIHFIYTFVNIIFLYTYFKKHKIGTVVIAIFLLMLGQRGFASGFHSLAYNGITIIMFALLIKWEICDKWRETNKNVVCWFKILICIVCILIMAKPYIMKSKYILPNDSDLPINQATSEYDKYIQELTDDEDKIYLYEVGLLPFYVTNNRLPASTVAANVPWFSELFEQEIIEDFKINQPKVIIYNPNAAVWGHVYQDFAPKLNTYIFTNYKYIEGTIVLVRNDYYDEAIKKLVRKNILVG